ncbi:hypothetical protein BCR32DRAFT_328215 [Anaeromyces robustus]|uniref:Uncharacterized protein n=1 Tax=Anaeromyces robustus TaxID=1754192 RepID=A0A1Y1X039_9FUNG|nr:hypothetical protein BCR32DRAFT_328215 [Anaeromyces robustus]|eukprot:ORX79207.1 hypothetical protein BCR32DRAFT_328215 [Anaeromyces robustus]
MLHIISVIVMIFYYKAANLYVQYKKRKADPDSIDISSCTHSTGFTTNKNTYGSNTNCVSSVQSLKGSNPSLKGSNNNLKGSNSNIKGSNTSVKGSNTALYTANDNTMNTSTFKGSNPRLYN